MCLDIFLILGSRHTRHRSRRQNLERQLRGASSSDPTGGETSDPADGIINILSDSEDDRAFSTPSPAPTQSDAGFQVDIPRGGAHPKYPHHQQHIIHAQIEEGNRGTFMSC